MARMGAGKSGESVSFTAADDAVMDGAPELAVALLLTADPSLRSRMTMS